MAAGRTFSSTTRLSKALVRRERGREDRRVVECRITQAGLALLADLDAAMAEADRRSLGSLSKEESLQLVDQRERIRATP